MNLFYVKTRLIHVAITVNYASYSVLQSQVLYSLIWIVHFGVQFSA